MPEIKSMNEITKFVSSARKIQRGDIYYIKREEKDECGDEIRAGRPAIIVSDDRENQTSNVKEVVYLTTQPKKVCQHTSWLLQARLTLPQFANR